MKTCILSRRNFLQGAAACTALTLIPGVHLLTGSAVAGEAGGGVRWGLLVDARLCTGQCDACVQACTKEHGLVSHQRPAIDAQWIRKVHVTDASTGLVSHFPLMCQHCAQAPCVDVCPTGASFRRADGLVLVNRHNCIGCRYCMMACPYKARTFVHETVEAPMPASPRGKGTVEGCTLCVHRIDAGQLPACVEACARQGHAALLFGDLNTPTSGIAKAVVTFATQALRPDLHTDTAVRYRGL